jgi:hypothetical protein
MASAKKPVKPMSKKPTLNDFLKAGKTPPSKNKKLPPDYDVVDKSMGYKKPTKKNPLPTKIKKK